MPTPWVRPDPIRWQRAPKRFRVQRTPLAGNPIAASGASHWFDTLDLTSSTDQSLPNRISGDPATMGSNPTQADTNDPTVLVHAGTNHVWFPGSGLNNLTASSAGTPTASLVMVLDFEPDFAWNSTGVTRWLMTFSASLNIFYLNVLGELRWGSTGTEVVSSGHPTTGRLQWRLERDLVTGTLSMAWRNDGVVDPSAAGWTVSGSGVSAGTFSGSMVQGVGDTNGARPCPGRLYHASHWIDGVQVRSTGTIGASQAVVGGYTVNRSTSGLTTAVVTSNRLLLDGIDDFIQLPADAIPGFTGTTGEFTVLVLHRKWHGTNTSLVWSGASAVNTAAFLMMSAGTQAVGWAGNRIATLPNTPNGEILYGRAMVLDDGVVRAWDQINGMTASSAEFQGTHLPLAWAPAPRIGTVAYATTNALSGEWFATVQWPRALTDQELTDAYNYLLSLRS